MQISFDKSGQIPHIYEDVTSPRTCGDPGEQRGRTARSFSNPSAVTHLPASVRGHLRFSSEGPQKLAMAAKSSSDRAG